MNLALDASAVIALLRSEPGAEVVEQLILDSANVSYMHAINACEVYYDALLVGNEEEAEAILRDIKSWGVIVSEEMDEALWLESARNKAYLRLPLGDCFLLAMAGRIGGEVVTADRGDLEPVAALGKFPIRFIR
jgi:ribonuclease VapC